MSSVKGKNTKLELTLRRNLWKNGIRGYLIHPNLPGTPDVAFTRVKLALFIDGCFWHKCPKCYTQPKSNTLFWEEKMKKNVARDKKVNNELHSIGWEVQRIWEHEIKNSVQNAVETVKRALENQSMCIRVL